MYQEYVVDLSIDPAERWDEMIRERGFQAGSLVGNALEQIEAGCPRWLPPSIVKLALGNLYRLLGGAYQEDLEAWGDALGIPLNDMIVANLSYDLSGFGCTAVAVKVPRLGMVHVRNLDWGLEGLEESSVNVRLRRGKREVLLVTFPGLVGALSGVVEGKFAVTLNWVASGETPSLYTSPLALLRWVLENARGYDEAVGYLTHTAMSTPALFLVTGSRDNQACVVERTQHEGEVRKYDGTPLVVTNHYTTDAFKHLNTGMDPYFRESSEERFACAFKRALTRNASAKQALSILEKEPLNNGETVQRMIFIPR